MPSSWRVGPDPGMVFGDFEDAFITPFVEARPRFRVAVGSVLSLLERAAPASSLDAWAARLRAFRGQLDRDDGYPQGALPMALPFGTDWTLFCAVFPLLLEDARRADCQLPEQWPRLLDAWLGPMRSDEGGNMGEVEAVDGFGDVYGWGEDHGDDYGDCDDYGDVYDAY